MHQLTGWRSALLLAVCCACTAEPAHQSTSSAWYQRSRVLDLTGANPRDSVVLSADGTRSDSLAIAARFFVEGVEVYAQRWTSADELYEADSLRNSPAAMDTFMRARLDDILGHIKREPINREQVFHMGDEAILQGIVPSPTHQVVLSYAFESSEFLAWDPRARRFVIFMECC